MEKEKVLEIEFKEVWGKYAWRIVKNTIPFNLTLSVVANEEVKLVESHKDNIYIFDDFEGLWDILDEDMLLYKEDKIKIENFVKEINSKYGVPKRWRAVEGGNFYYINDVGDIGVFTDNYTKYDDYYYNIGNYFKTKELATKYRDTVWIDAFNKIKDLNTD